MRRDVDELDKGSVLGMLFLIHLNRRKTYKDMKRFSEREISVPTKCWLHVVRDAYDCHGISHPEILTSTRENLL